MSAAEQLVLVTGASGYIATWVTKFALDAGYRVRGTVRDPSNEKKVKVLKSLPGAAERLELVALDIEKSDQSEFDKALDGVTLVAHTASPFPAQDPKSEDELIKPAVNGTVSVLKAALRHDTVKKVVVTSSVAAVGSANSDQVEVKSDKDWTDLTNPAVGAYAKSKTLAEKAAWDFYEENKPSWSLTTINPSFVVGPYLNPEKSTSAEIGIRLLSGATPIVPKLSFGFVDVRDVAKAHIKALEADPEIVNGRRFILSNKSLWMKEMARYMIDEFKPLGYYGMSTGEAPYPILWLMSWFDKSIATILPLLSRAVDYDSSPSKEILHIEYHPIEKTIASYGHSLIYHGMVGKSSKYKLPREDWTPLNAD